MAWIFKRPDSKYWWIGWRANGRQFLKSTRKTAEAEAEAKLREHEFLANAHRDGKLTGAIIESLTGRPLSQVTFKSALDEWLTECQGATAPGTLARYKIVADELTQYLGATAQKPLLRDVTTDGVRGFLVFKRSKTSAANTNQNRRILATFFLRAIRNSQLRENPMLPIRKYKPGKDEVAGRRSLTLAELQLIYQKAPNDFWRYMIVGGFYCGLRLGDLAQLQWGSVDFDANMLRVQTGKTGKTVNVPIAKPFLAMLRELEAKRNTDRPSDYLWPDKAALYSRQAAKVFSQEFYEDILVPCGLARPRTHKADKKTPKGRGAQREIMGVSFHSIRHSFVSYLKFTGASQSTAKELAGHSSNQVSDLYTDVPEEALTKAIGQLPDLLARRLVQ